MKILAQRFTAKIRHKSILTPAVISVLHYTCRVDKESFCSIPVILEDSYRADPYTLSPVETMSFNIGDSYVKYISRNYLLNPDISTTYSPNFKRSPIRWAKTLPSTLKRLVQYFYNKFK